jgi:hypothetical protein
MSKSNRRPAGFQEMQRAGPLMLADSDNGLTGSSQPSSKCGRCAG